MRSLTFITDVLLVNLSIDSHTVEVQAGQDVTLLCSNISTRSTQTNWFRVVNRTKPCCIPSVFSHIDQVKLCHDFQMDLSYSGLYFCGLYMDTHKVIASATLLNVQCHDGMTKIMNMILGGLTVFLTIIIIFLAVKVRKLQTGKVHLLVNCVSIMDNSEVRETETNVVYAAT
uniref:Ig-like domain-containing protein n=1 Tax=Mola mola TaxID=94237 RepID=A0A3Q4AU96_MOLML